MSVTDPLFETVRYHLYVCLLWFMSHYIITHAACSIKIWILSSGIIGPLLWTTVQEVDVTEYRILFKRIEFKCNF